MTTQGKKQIYNRIMEDVSRIVIKHLNEVCTEDDDFDIRDYYPKYKNLISWIDIIDNNILTEALEPDFSNNIKQFFKKELIRWIKTVDMAGSTHLKTIQFKILPSQTITDIVLIDPEKLTFIPKLNDFMSRRNYSLIFYKKNGNRLHLVYADNEGVEVDLNVLESHKNCDGHIYHLTPAYNIEAIKQNGFELSSRNNSYGITYPERAYYFPFKKEALDYQATIKSEHLTDNLALFAIPISGIKNIKFYLDPLTQVSRGMYTESKIDYFDGITYDIL